MESVAACCAGREEKREVVRFNHEEAARMYNVDKIGARIATDQYSCSGALLDLSAGGMAILAPEALSLNLQVQIELWVGHRLVKGLGLVKNRTRAEGQYRLGIQFSSLGPEEEAFLQLLYGPGGTYEEVDGLAESE